MTSDTLPAPDFPEEPSLFDTPEPPPDRWVVVNARGLARTLSRYRLLSPAMANAFAMALPETTSPACALFQDSAR